MTLASKQLDETISNTRFICDQWVKKQGTSSLTISVMTLLDKLTSNGKEYHIAWNSAKTEGFITDDEDDANSAKTGKPHRKHGYASISTAAEAFHNAYEGDKLTIQKVSL